MLTFLLATNENIVQLRTMFTHHFLYLNDDVYCLIFIIIVIDPVLLFGILHVVIVSLQFRIANRILIKSFNPCF